MPLLTTQNNMIRKSLHRFVIFIIYASWHSALNNWTQCKLFLRNCCWESDPSRCIELHTRGLTAPPALTQHSLPAPCTYSSLTTVHLPHLLITHYTAPRALLITHYTAPPALTHHSLYCTSYTYSALTILHHLHSLSAHYTSPHALTRHSI